MREVVLVCGPPGSGKTTRARALASERDLRVFDRDDPQWGGSEGRFLRALEHLGRDPGARAVVIRAGSTRSARESSAELIGATDVEVLAVDPQTCVRRVVSRKRPRPPIRTQIAGVRSWWGTYEPSPPRRSRRW